MAEIRAFRGFRYDLGRVGSLASVICPPYDVIDTSLQEKLYQASPYNAIRVELTRDEPTDTETLNKYTRAARQLKEWLASDIVKQDTARSLYVYEQEFTVEGKTYTRRGFLARVRLEPFGTGRIYPHEQTLAGPKADRLKLYQATAFNISPVFGLYPDADGEVFQLIEPLIRKQPPISAQDHLGVVNRLWVLTDSTTVSAVMGAMGPKPVFIADGHHRYETGLKYLELERQAGAVPDAESPQNFCLMMLVGMSDPGLIILPTHRLVSGLPNLTQSELLDILQSEFDRVQDCDLAEAWDILQMDGGQNILAFHTVADGKTLVVRLRNEKALDTLAPEHSEDWRQLGVSVLHRLVLENMLPKAIPDTKPLCKYVHLLQEVEDAVKAKECQVAVLVPPATMDHVETIAGNRETMPPKSTYFFPKLLTGLVYNSLTKD